MTVVLGEEQIQRYSRQILLKEVGGVGQRTLLGASVEVVGEGAALETAARYLAAGGTPVRGVSSLAPFDPALDPSAPVAVTLCEAGRSDRKAQAERGGAERVRTRDVPVGEDERAEVQIVSLEGGRTRIAYRSADACRACFAGLLGAGGAPVSLAGSVTAGALAALCAQRLILGSLRGAGALELEPDGGLSPVTLERCPDHR